jgi:hypothetical protein
MNRIGAILDGIPEYLFVGSILALPLLGFVGCILCIVSRQLDCYNG